MRSSEFIDFIFPCKACLVRAACKDKVNEMKKALYGKRAARCLTVPYDKVDEKNTHHKMLLECWANLGPKIINHTYIMISDIDSRETENNLPGQYIFLMRDLMGILQWMVNSTSWDLGVLQEFDKFEIKTKLKGLRL